VEFPWDRSTTTGFTYDLSPSSLFVRSIRIPKLGIRLAVRLFPPNAKPISLSGAVLRSFRVPSSLARTIPSGFCLALTERPPEDYLTFLAAL